MFSTLSINCCISEYDNIVISKKEDHFSIDVTDNFSLNCDIIG